MIDIIYSKNKIQLLTCGQQDCSDLHSWGPGIRACYIIHYIIHGAGYLKQNGKTYRITGGQSFLTCPNTVIEYYPDPLDPWTYTWVDFMGDEVESWIESTGFHNKQPICTLDLSIKLYPLFQQLKELDVISTNANEAGGILRTILGIYSDLFSFKRRDGGSKDDYRLEKALMLITSNYHKQTFHVDSLCQMMNMNRVTLYRLFQAAYQVSPSSFIIQYRLEQSKLVLSQGLSVKNAAISSGFSDPFYYSRIFKKYFNFSPSQYIINIQELGTNPSKK